MKKIVLMLAMLLLMGCSVDRYEQEKTILKKIPTAKVEPITQKDGLGYWVALDGTNIYKVLYHSGNNDYTYTSLSLVLNH